YSMIDGTQLINVSSGGGYTIVADVVTYCATKFYVSAFTEVLSHELKEQGAKLQAKVYAPAATETDPAKRSFD
ncbi:SDR family NAD(P)-dependent oxidoreductase, partial [Bacillus paralicheniformis]|uniref:SDR family NAD(P)-dependent oxidoreductase n=1 Tax=Bacillus paralicheniformis TaxID=1648923 RepID=UPI0020BEA694